MRKLLFLLILLSLSTASYSAERIVSVGGSLTEIVYALGAEKLLVGSDTTSYYPPAAEALPKVGYQRALSAEGILSLNPDLLILSDESGPPAVLKQLETAGVDFLINKAGRSLDDVKDNIQNIAKALNLSDQGKALIQSIEATYQELQQTIRDKPNSKNVMFIMQIAGGAPLVAGTNTAADSMIHLSGANNVVTDYEGYKPLTPESLIVLKPEVIIMTDQGLEQAGGEKSVLKSPGIAITPAAQKGNIISMDSLKILGFGPRSVDAALELNQQISRL